MHTFYMPAWQRKAEVCPQSNYGQKNAAKLLRRIIRSSHISLRNGSMDAIVAVDEVHFSMRRLRVEQQINDETIQVKIFVKKIKFHAKITPTNSSSVSL